MQTNSPVTILALFQLLCGLTLAQNHSTGSKSEILQSLVEGRHVGLDVCDLLTEDLDEGIARIGNARGLSPPGHWPVVSWSRQFAVSRTAERLACGDAQFSSTRRPEHTRLCNDSRQL
jgi:hypothetical protein